MTCSFMPPIMQQKHDYVVYFYTTKSYFHCMFMKNYNGKKFLLCYVTNTHDKNSILLDPKKMKKKKPYPDTNINGNKDFSDVNIKLW